MFETATCSGSFGVCDIETGLTPARETVSWFWVNDLSRYGDAILNLTIAAAALRLRSQKLSQLMGVSGDLPGHPWGLHLAGIWLPPGGPGST